MKTAGFAALAVMWLLAAPAVVLGQLRSPRPPQSPDILLITIDTLRADAPRFAGNRKAATPPPPPRAGPGPPRPPHPPGGLLSAGDALGPGAVGFAGNRRAATPVLDRLAGQGRVFT